MPNAGHGRLAPFGPKLLLQVAAEVVGRQGYIWGTRMVLAILLYQYVTAEAKYCDTGLYSVLYCCIAPRHINNIWINSRLDLPAEPGAGDVYLELLPCLLQFQDQRLELTHDLRAAFCQVRCDLVA